uniref:Uncharacterized protein n=1 Tax=Chromera velia CCMP2878 TaxID=1169474 RepID=A0A0G4HPI5_9ALVE|eukprot:Cvel_7786.t1-p1 / transcript=Cvel_7786.t1 / gene=Cvel_7786 / organism=Chromera_velia_CCMP2878 / gene_product=hypothetical protein / transcript_product=hypothetical protein / location=Cvel_scaffold415:15302-19258(+) / protein_length=1123 / sequence_SO=supercontig / SO=protein_coding / is_pseudo=false
MRKSSSGNEATGRDHRNHGEARNAPTGEKKKQDEGPNPMTSPSGADSGAPAASVGSRRGSSFSPAVSARGGNKEKAPAPPSGPSGLFNPLPDRHIQPGSSIFRIWLKTQNLSLPNRSDAIAALPPGRPFHETAAGTRERVRPPRLGGGRGVGGAEGGVEAGACEANSQNLLIPPPPQMRQISPAAQASLSPGPPPPDASGGGKGAFSFSASSSAHSSHQVNEGITAPAGLLPLPTPTPASHFTPCPSSGSGRASESSLPLPPPPTATDARHLLVAPPLLHSPPSHSSAKQQSQQVMTGLQQQAQQIPYGSPYNAMRDRARAETHRLSSSSLLPRNHPVREQPQNAQNMNTGIPALGVLQVARESSTSVGASVSSSSLHLQPPAVPPSDLSSPHGLSPPPPVSTSPQFKEGVEEVFRKNEAGPMRVPTGHSPVHPPGPGPGPNVPADPKSQKRKPERSHTLSSSVAVPQASGTNVSAVYGAPPLPSLPLSAETSPPFSSSSFSSSSSSAVFPWAGSPVIGSFWQELLPTSSPLLAPSAVKGSVLNVAAAGGGQRGEPTGVGSVCRAGGAAQEGGGWGDMRRRNDGGLLEDRLTHRPLVGGLDHVSVPLSMGGRFGGHGDEIWRGAGGDERSGVLQRPPFPYRQSGTSPVDRLPLSPLEQSPQMESRLLFPVHTNEGRAGSVQQKPQPDPIAMQHFMPQYGGSLAIPSSSLSLTGMQSLPFGFFNSTGPTSVPLSPFTQALPYTLSPLPLDTSASRAAQGPPPPATQGRLAATPAPPGVSGLPTANRTEKEEREPQSHLPPPSPCRDTPTLGIEKGCGGEDRPRGLSQLSGGASSLRVPFPGPELQLGGTPSGGGQSLTNPSEETKRFGGVAERKQNVPTEREPASSPTSHSVPSSSLVTVCRGDEGEEEEQDEEQRSFRTSRTAPPAMEKGISGREKEKERDMEGSVDMHGGTGCHARRARGSSEPSGRGVGMQLHCKKLSTEAVLAETKIQSHADNHEEVCEACVAREGGEVVAEKGVEEEGREAVVNRPCWLCAVRKVWTDAAVEPPPTGGGESKDGPLSGSSREGRASGSSATGETPPQLLSETQQPDLSGLWKEKERERKMTAEAVERLLEAAKPDRYED